MREQIAILLLCLGTGAANGRAVPAFGDVLGVWFSPGGGATSAIVEQFGKAKTSIDYSMYNFTSEPIADALMDAHRRGVKVTLLLDKRASASRHCQAPRCRKVGIKVYTDSVHPIAHNKVRIIDGKLLMSGSFNDSANAERNAENVYLEDDPVTVRKYSENFRHHLEHAERMK